MKIVLILAAALALSGCAGAVFPLAPVVGEVAGVVAGEHPGYTTRAWQGACSSAGGEWHGAPGAECEGNLLALIFGG